MRGLLGRGDGAQLSGPGIGSWRSARRLRPAAPKLPQREVDRALRRAGITERREASGSDLLSEPVLILSQKGFYNQDGLLRATMRSPAPTGRFFRKLSLGAPRRFEVVDVQDRLVLNLDQRPTKYWAVAADGTEMGLVDVGGPFWKKRQTIEAAGETIGRLGWVRNNVYGVLDAQDRRVATITRVPGTLIHFTVMCIVVEIDAAMPKPMRPLMLPASKAVSFLTEPRGGG
jgi:hypothetical protein